MSNFSTVLQQNIFRQPYTKEKLPFWKGFSKSTVTHIVLTAMRSFFKLLWHCTWIMKSTFQWYYVMILGNPIILFICLFLFSYQNLPFYIHFFQKNILVYLDFFFVEFFLSFLRKQIMLIARNYSSHKIDSYKKSCYNSGIKISG